MCTLFEGSEPSLYIQLAHYLLADFKRTHALTYLLTKSLCGRAAFAALRSVEMVNFNKRMLVTFFTC